MNAQNNKLGTAEALSSRLPRGMGYFGRQILGQCVRRTWKEFSIIGCASPPHAIFGVLTRNRGLSCCYAAVDHGETNLTILLRKLSAEFTLIRAPSWSLRLNVDDDGSPPDNDDGGGLHSNGRGRPMWAMAATHRQYGIIVLCTPAEITHGAIFIYLFSYFVIY